MVSRGVGTHAAVAAVWDGGMELGGDIDALFDLASLTKPVLALAYLEQKDLHRDRVERWVPEAEGTATGQLPLELLLAHRAGLDAHAPLFAPLLEGRAVDEREALRTAARARREAKRLEPPEEGWEPLYSDLGYLLAGVALARRVGTPDAGAAMSALVLRKLGLERELGTARTLEAAGVGLAGRVAPTEDVAWRGGIVRGRVHDENAWALTGMGGSGHAGLFGTVRAVAALVAHLIELGDALGWTVRSRPGGTLRAGFDGKSLEGSSAGSVLGPRTFGHLGFTGTSFWIDPEARVGVVLLTNRVHPTRNATDGIRAARPHAHDTLARYALAKTGRRSG
jgi:CubicO group peptidase (beta-lactamase class C family)